MRSGPDQDQWYKISWIIRHQRNRRVHPGKGFIGSSDVPAISNGTDDMNAYNAEWVYFSSHIISSGYWPSKLSWSGFSQGLSKFTAPLLRSSLFGCIAHRESGVCVLLHSLATENSGWRCLVPAAHKLSWLLSELSNWLSEELSGKFQCTKVHLPMHILVPNPKGRKANAW